MDDGLRPEPLCALGLPYNCIFKSKIISLQLMIHKKSFNARIIFSLMVPISVIAFIAGKETVSIGIDHFGIFDGVIISIMYIFSLDSGQQVWVSSCLTFMKRNRKRPLLKHSDLNIQKSLVIKILDVGIISSIDSQ